MISKVNDENEAKGEKKKKGVEWRRKSEKKNVFLEKSELWWRANRIMRCSLSTRFSDWSVLKKPV